MDLLIAVPYNLGEQEQEVLLLHLPVFQSPFHIQFLKIMIEIIIICSIIIIE